MNASIAAIEAEQLEERKALRLAIFLTALTALGLIIGILLQFNQAPKMSINGAFALAYLAGGVPSAISALGALRKGHLDIDLLMVLAALAAAAVGEMRDGAILLFLFSLAGTLEDYALGNTKRAVTSLMKLNPDTANLLENGQTRSVNVSVLKLDDRVLVKPGERVPVDGEIMAGQSAIDQSPITGESVPVDKTVGETVFAGTVNGFGALEVKVSKLASESTLARMVKLVTEAREQRAPSERFSDWFGKRYTIFVLTGSMLALLVFFLLKFPAHEAFYKAATLLVVASPCAIVISVPAAVLSALASAARHGVLFKGGGALEDFGHTKVMAFDKTGTLTQGKMQVSDVVSFVTEDWLGLLAALEEHSEHPIAHSILSYAKKQNLAIVQAQNVEAIPGKGLRGVIDGKTYWAGNRKLLEARGAILNQTMEATLSGLEAEGKTILLFGSENSGSENSGSENSGSENISVKTVLGIVSIADTVRPDAKATLEHLKTLGVKRLVMLTGDHSGVAQAVGTKLGFQPNDIHGGLLPQEKLELVKHLGQEGSLAYLGDGVNDAAALAAANVGIAMGVAGSDVAMEAADVALLSDDLTKLPDALALAQRANRVIRQNLSFALGIMILMVIITLFWHLPLPLGVIGHEGGTLLVVANGLRLLWSYPKTKQPALSSEMKPSVARS
jgi:Zn2+/Cd2+-exporting ATPase